jgi:voltage-gated potassium channel
MASLSRLRVAALFVVAVVGVGVLGYRLLEGYTWLEALYMTAITLSTVGFQEVRPLSQMGRLFTVALLAAGLGVVLYTAVAIAEQVVAGEFQRILERRRMEKRIAVQRDHYLVCGFGRIGRVICRELATKPMPFVVVDHADEAIRKAEEAGYLVLQGDATDEATLLAAGVQQARGLFAALSTDAANVFVTLTAKELNPALFVVARAESERSERTLLRGGADKVISPYAMGGHRMAQAALRPAVVEFIDLATHHQSLELQLEEIGVASHSACDGVALGEAGLCEQYGVIVVAIKRASGKMIFKPAPEETLQAGDRLVVLGEAPRLRQVEQLVGGGGRAAPDNGAGGRPL